MLEKVANSMLYMCWMIRLNPKFKPRLEDYYILQEFRDIFPNELPGLPPKRYIEFTIELVPGAASESKAPYCMSTPELIE